MTSSGLRRSAALLALTTGSIATGVAIAPAASAQGAPTTTASSTAPATAGAAKSTASAAKTVAPAKTAASPTKSATVKPLQGNFGLGKLQIKVLPKAGTVPSDVTAVVGAQVKVTDGDIPAETCTVQKDGYCHFPSTNTMARWLPASVRAQLTNDTYYVYPGDTQPVLTQISAPDYFALPANPQKTAPTCSSDTASNRICPVTRTFYDPGLYRTIGLHLSSTADGSALAGGTYVLCSEAAKAPSASGSGCPTGTSAADTETTGSSGDLTFKGLFKPGAGYSVYEKSAPTNYVKDASRRVFTVPAAKTAAEAGVPVIVKATNAPVPPSAVDDSATTDAGQSVDIDVLANDKGYGQPLTITSATAPGHGTATVSNGRITYAPASGFSGTDTFTYTISDAGGTATATVKVTVHAVVQPASGGSDELAQTGADASQLAELGGFLIAGGALAMLATRWVRRRGLHRAG